MSLPRKAVAGTGWAALTEISVQGFRFVVGLVLARLVAPDQFGLLAMVTVFITISLALVEGGLGRAIIQREDLTDEDCSTVFWFNLAASGVAAGVVCLAAPAVAAFYGEGRLAAIMQVLSLGFFLQGLGVCQRSRMIRDLLFKRLMVVQLPALVAGAGAGIALAATGFGVWALVVQHLVSGVFVTAFLWIGSDWRPGFRFNAGRFRQLFGYGWKIAVERTIDELVMNIYVLVIGKLFLPLQVGYYHRANGFQKMPAGVIQQVLTKVAFPVMCSLQGSIERLRKGVEGVLRVTSLVTFPVFAGMMAVAGPMIESLIGPRWLPAAPYLQVLCLVGMLWPIQSLNLTVVLALGRSGLSLRLLVIKRLAMVLAILLTFRHGVMALLWGQAACALFALFVNTWPNRALVGFPMERQLAVMLPYLASAALMGMVVAALVTGVEWHPWAELGVGVLAGVVLFGACVKLMRIRAHREFAGLAGDFPVIGPMVRFVLT